MQQEFGYCVAEGQDLSEGELDPDRECGPNDPTFSFLSPCKNNCRGGISVKIMCKLLKFFLLVNFSVVSGGAALIAATSVVGQLVAPALGAAVLGIGGVGGNIVAQNMCLGKHTIMEPANWKK